MKQPIGIIDSGVGGLSVTAVLMRELPNESIIYLADSKNCPYGNKTPQEIYNLSKQMIEYLIKNKAKLVLIACNTITTSCIDKLRDDFPKIPIVGIVPVIKTAVEKSINKQIGILSTKNTAESNYQKDLINKFGQNYSVLNLGSSTLVTLIENLDFKNMKAVLRQELKPFKTSGIDVLALGCSHFPLISDRIQEFLPHVLILNSSDAVTRQVKRILINNKMLSNSKDTSYNFYTTGDLKALDYFVNKLTNKAKLSKISLQ